LASRARLLLEAVEAVRGEWPAELPLFVRLSCADWVDGGFALAEAVAALKNRGARNVYCCATHALLSGPAVERLAASAATEIVVTNTVPIPEEKQFPQLTVLSVGDLIARAIRYTHSNESVSSLFE
jgi:ribose-phosphate pyrophosphokinase